MLLTPEARQRRHQIDERLNPGYRYAEPARLLADAYALALTVAEQTQSPHLKRDSLDCALQIEEFLLDTLSEVRISRGDVEARFENLREQHPNWPNEIPTEAWQRLAESRTLRDIADVVCGGGDYWEAINVALYDEFEPSTLQPAIHTLYYAVEERDWQDLVQFRSRLDASQAPAFDAIVTRVEERTAERFGMVVWSVQDILDAAARARGSDQEYGDEATWEQAEVTQEWVRDIMVEANSSISDRMTERGWEVLEDIISERLPPGG